MTAMQQTLVINGQTWTQTWSAATDIVETISPEGRRTQVRLDAIGEAEQVTLPGRAAITIGHDLRGRPDSFLVGTGPTARSTELVWNADGFIESIVEPHGTTVFALDPLGRVLAATRPDATTTQVTYDADGAIEVLTPPTQPGHGFGYDATHRVSRYEPPVVAGAAMPDTTFEFNEDQQPVAIERPDGATIDFVYAAGSGRLTEIGTPLGAYELTYDAAGHVATASDPFGGGLAFGYDGPLPTSEVLTGEVDGSVQWSYDDELRVMTESVNASSPITFTYDDDGLRTGAGSEVIARDLDSGAVVGTTIGTSTSEFGYDGFGDPTSLVYEVDGDPLYSATYERDEVGRIETMTEAVLGGAARVVEYEYDLGGRLASVTVDSVLAYGYGYDDNGNRETVTTTAGTVTATFDDQDRMLTHGDDVFAFTSNGELSTRTDTVTDDETSYDYDVLGNLLGVELPDDTSIEYVIDARSRRVGKRVDGVLERGWIYGDRLEPIAELDGAGNITARFVYGVQAHVPDYMVRGGISYRFVTDQLGSVRLVVNLDTGAIAQRLEYDPWGVVTLDTNPEFQPFGYAGGLYDVHTGMVRFGARDYDASTGRWTAKDPLGFGGDDTNLYAYVAGDPINSIDPSGLYSWWNFMNDATNSAAAFGDTLSFGASSGIRDMLGISDAVDKCSGAYSGGELAGNAFSLGFGAAHLGRNLLAQGGKLGRMAYDPRSWGRVRSQWSKATGGLKPKGQHLHHWLFPQRWAAVPPGIRNAGFNYLPLSAGFNSWMNGSTMTRSAAEWGFKAMGLSIYAGMSPSLGGRCGCD